MEILQTKNTLFRLSLGRFSGTSSRGAFALVSTLVVLGLALMVALWMVVQIGVEVRSSHAAWQRSQAQANALAGMQMALGALQEEAGADQRITARAELLDGAEGTLALDGVTQPFWTGIWKTGPNEPDVAIAGSTPQREISLGSLTPTLAGKSSSASWMVSKPKGAAALDPRSFTATVGTRVADVAEAAAQSGVSEAPVGTAPTAAVLAKNIGRRDPSAGSAGNPGYVVAAPLVEIRDVADSKLRGRYAYWVSDEGVKAKVNLVGDGVLASESAARRQRHFTSPGGTAPDLALEPGFRAALRSQVAGNATTLSKVQFPESLNFLLPGSSFPESAEGFKLSWPDFTTHSHGVLGDVKNGGLKKDLTAAFESPQAFTEFIDSNPTKTGILLPPAEQKKRVWSTESPAADLQDNGSYWASFYFHYNLYKASMPSYRTVAPVGTAPKGVGGPSSTTPEVEVRTHYLANYLSRNGTPAPEGRLFHLAPAVLGIRYEVGISSEQVGPTGTYSLRLHHFPAIIYHNPYNVRLVPTIGSPNPFSLQFITNVFSGFSFSLDFSINSTVKLAQAPLTFRLNGNSLAGENFSLEVIPAELVFEPGEIKIFGLSSDDPKPSLSTASNNSTNPHVVTGLTTQDIDLQANKSARMSGGAALDGLNNLNPTDTISIEPSNNQSYGDRLRANGYLVRGLNMKQWPDATTGTYEALFGRIAIEGLSDFTPQGTERGDIFGVPLPVSSLNPAAGGGSIQRIQGFTVAAKGYMPERDTKAAMFGGSGSRFFPGNVIKAVNFADLRNRVGTMFTPDEEFAFTALGASYYGTRDAGRAGGSTRVILKELPLQPMLSLGQYQHVDDGFYSTDSTNARWAKSSFIPVGGSLPNPGIANQGEVEGFYAVRPYQIGYDSDTAYLNNRELFDRTFFSTIPPADNLKADGSVNGTRYPAEWQDFTQASVDTGRALLNSRLVFTPRPDGTSPRLAGTDSDRPLRSTRHAAAGLLVDGAFNVNSTSVAAWRAILSSLRFSDQVGGNPMPRFTTSLVTGDNYGEGMRVLTDDQVDRLAREIVNQVKLRGPFLSMGDFINRRRVAGALGERGALQTAIDASGINSDALAALGSASNKVVSAAMRFPASFAAMLAGYMPANTAMGAPGVIMQHDLLQALAPILAARSDTFVIRAYGEAVNPATGATEGSAWCEAVVQRVPEYVDQSDPKIAALGSATHPDTLEATSANARLGRRFKVVSFRWLGESEL